MQKAAYILMLTLLLALATGCSQAPTPSPQPIFTPAAMGSSSTTRSNGEAVTASAVIVPIHEAQVSFAQGGLVKTLSVSEGEMVGTGQVLAQLEGEERLQAAVIVAESELLAAQLALSDLSENLAVAQAQAYQAVVDANQAVGEAKYRLYYFTVPYTLEGLEPMQALEQAKENLDQARQAFEPYMHKSESNATRKDLKEALDRAQSDYNAALRRVQLEAALVTTQANLEKALRELQILKEGPDPDAVAMAEARLRNAQAQIEVAKANLDQATLYAPIDGMVLSVEIFPGEAVLPGQVIAQIADLSHLRVETSDLSERDVSKVAIGQKASVYIEALGLEIQGQVVSIARQANTIGGDVVYTVEIELDEQPQSLRWGMSAEVEIHTE